MSNPPARSPAAEDQPLISCESIGRVYPGADSGWFRSGGSRAAVQALEDVTLDIRRGEYLSISGPSGSGKTTLIHILAVLDTPSSGTVTFGGRDVSALSQRARTRLRLEQVGLVFQRFHLLPSLTARSNVALPLVERGLDKASRRRRATELLERVGLGDRLTHRPGQLSGGEQQRVAIARALVNDPDLLLADEPTGELDSATGERILDIFDELAADRAVVIASHDERVAEAAHRKLRLRDGRLLRDD